MDLVKGHRIDLEFQSITSRKVLSCKEMHLTLFEQRIEYKIVGTYECPDEDTGITKLYNANYRWCRARKDIACLSMNYSNSEKKYLVEMSFHGVMDDFGAHFDEPKECLKLYELLKKYFYE